MLIKNKKIIYLIFVPSIFLFGFLININFVLASTINFSPSEKSYEVGGNISIDVLVSSSTSINAVATKILYPKDLLTLSSISKNKSIISLWAQEPLYSNSQGVASFEGVILNGYIGGRGNLITLIFKAKNEGEAILNFSDSSILANDGYGTELFSGSGKSVLTIKKAIKKEPTVTSPKEVVNEIEKEVLVKIDQTEETRNLQDNSLLVLIIALILIIILVVLFAIYYVRKSRNYFKKSLEKTELKIGKEIKNFEDSVLKEIDDIEKEI